MFLLANNLVVEKFFLPKSTPYRLDPTNKILTCCQVTTIGRGRYRFRGMLDGLERIRAGHTQWQRNCSTLLIMIEEGAALINVCRTARAGGTRQACPTLRTPLRSP